MRLESTSELSLAPRVLFAHDGTSTSWQKSRANHEEKHASSMMNRGNRVLETGKKRSIYRSLVNFHAIRYENGEMASESQGCAGWNELATYRESTNRAGIDDAEEAFYDACFVFFGLLH